MKKVFFFLFIGLIPFTTIQGSTKDLIVETERKDDEFYVRIGVEDGWSFTRGGDGLRYQINGYGVRGNAYVFYGSVLRSVDDTRIYDGYVLVVDAAGEIVLEEIVHLGAHEEIVRAFMLDGRFVFQCRQSDEATYAETITEHFLIYEATGAHVTTAQFEAFFHRATQFDEMLFLSTEREGPYELMLDNDGKTHERAVHGVKDDEVYSQEVVVYLLEPVYLNGVRYPTGAHRIDYPGHYILEGKTPAIQFTIETVITGVEDGMVTHEPVKIDVSSGHVFLNHQPMLAGKPVRQPGYYTLVVQGVNGYEKTLDFTIEATLKGIEDNAFYQSAPTVQFTGDGYLNNQKIASGYHIQESGEHTLKIIGENGYEISKTFTVFTPDDGGLSRFMRLEIGLIASAIFIGGIALIGVVKNRK